MISDLIDRMSTTLSNNTDPACRNGAERTGLYTGGPLGVSRHRERELESGKWWWEPGASLPRRRSAVRRTCIRVSDREVLGRTGKPGGARNLPPTWRLLVPYSETGKNADPKFCSERAGVASDPGNGPPGVVTRLLRTIRDMSDDQLETVRRALADATRERAGKGGSGGA